MAHDIPSISDLEATQLLNKHYAEVITSKEGGVSSAADITQTTNPITGVTRRTLYKILDDAQAEHDAQISAHEAEHDAQISAHEAEHDAQMQEFESDFDGRLAGMAFTRVGSFTTGATLTDMRQVLIWEVSQGGDGHEYGWSGTFPKVVAAGATPATSGGIGDGAWVDRTDVTLRSDLNVVVKVFESVADMVADASLVVCQKCRTLGYYAAGDGGGNDYEIVTASTGTDDGGSFISISNGLQAKGLFSDGIVNVCQFGAKGDGVTNDTVAIVSAATHSNTTRYTLTCLNLNVKLAGSADIIIKTNADFTGTIFACKTWTGRFYIQRTKGKVTYTSTDNVVTSLSGSSSLGVGSSVFSGWDTITDINDCFIKINTSQNFYKFRTETRLRTDLNKTYRNGVVSSPLKYSLAGVGITSIDAYPMEDNYRSVTGLTLDLTGCDTSSNYIKIETSLFELKNTRFILDDTQLVNTNPTLIKVIDSCDIKIKGAYTSFVNRTTATTGFTYTLSLNDSYNIVCEEIQSDGDGWGATGSSTCARVEYVNCNLNRIDFHEPFRDYLNIHNCVIGTNGVIVTALGDLNITDTRFILRDTVHNINHNIISTRADSGGFCDGNLTVTNCTVSGSVSTDIMLFSHYFETGNDKPSGSPIDYKIWDKISIDNVKNLLSYAINYWPSYTDNGGVLKFASKISVTNSYGGKFRSSHFSNAVPSKTAALTTSPFDGDFNLRIYLANSDIYLIEISGNSQFNIELKCNNVFSIGNNGTALSTNTPGHYIAYGCNISKINTNFNSVNYGPIVVETSSSLLNDDSSIYGGSDMVITTTNTKVNLINTKIRAILSQRLVDTLHAKHINCSYYSTTPLTIIDITNDIQASTGTLTLTPTYVQVGQEVGLLCGYTSDNTQTIIKTQIPSLNSSVTVCVGLTQFVRLYRASDTTITVTSSGSPIVRRLVLLGV